MKYPLIKYRSIVRSYSQKIKKTVGQELWLYIVLYRGFNFPYLHEFKTNQHIFNLSTIT